MGKGITLRIPVDIQLSSEMLVVLEKRFPNHLLERFSEIPDYQRSYRKRVDSIYQAFKFLWDAYPLPQGNTPITEETFRTAVDIYKSEYDHSARLGDGKSVDTLQTELKAFVGKLITVVSLAYNKSSSEAIELLNQAEQYVLMAAGRNDVVTLSRWVSVDQDPQYLLEVDESIPPYYPEILEELAQIKAMNYPKTPPWFLAFKQTEHHYKQAYFCNLGSILDLVMDFNEFLSSWEHAKKNVLNIDLDLQKISKKTSPAPDWFEKLPMHQQEMVRVLSTELSLAAIEEKIADFKLILEKQEYKDSLAQFITIPQWYWVLSEHQQCFLEHTLKHKETIEEAVSVLSSRHRRLPLPANLGRHYLLILNNTGEFRQLYSEKYRSSHIATRDDLEHLPLAVQHRHVSSNLLKVMEKAEPGQLISLQTLISPLGSDLMPFLSSLLPDFNLHKMARSAIIDKAPPLSIIRTNHPLNKARYILYTTSYAENSRAFIAALSEYIPSVEGLALLINSYSALLNSQPGSATVFDNIGRELFLSSLEQILIAAVGGYSYGSCVSGKDRKGVELIHTDAMYLYKEKYRRWPEFNDEPSARAPFVSLVADMFMTHHQEELAGLNAPGSEGIKTPYEYFPDDISAEINRRLRQEAGLTISDRLASNNELREIYRGKKIIEKKPIEKKPIEKKPIEKKLIEEDVILCQLVAKQLGEDSCEKLYTQLFLLVNKESLFIPKAPESLWDALSSPTLFRMVIPQLPKLPNGIQKIIVLTKDGDAGNSIARMAAIFDIILKRRETDASRTPVTQTIYNDIRNLLKFHEEDSATLVNTIVAKWSAFFDSPQAHCKTERSTCAP